MAKSHRSNSKNTSHRLRIVEGSVDLEAVVEDLKDAIKNLHPDHYGGAFRNENDKNAFHAASAALEKLERAARNSNALTIPGAREVAISSEPGDLAEYRKKQELEFIQVATQRRTQRGAELADKANKRFTRRRWIATSAAAAFFGLLAVSEELQRNQIAAPVIQSSTARIFFLAALLSSGVLAGVNWILERRTGVALQWLTSGEAQAEMFSSFKYRGDKVDGLEPETISFTKRQVMDVIELTSKRKLRGPETLRKWIKLGAVKFRILSKRKDEHDYSFQHRVDELADRLTTLGSLGTEQIEEIALAHLDELSRRGVIRQAPEKRVNPVYWAEKSALED